jgi:hypothetical protein
MEVCFLSLGLNSIKPKPGDGAAASDSADWISFPGIKFLHRFLPLRLSYPRTTVGILHRKLGNLAKPNHGTTHFIYFIYINKKIPIYNGIRIRR